MTSVYQYISIANLGNKMGFGDNKTDFTFMHAGFTATTVDRWISEAERWVNKIKGRSENDPYTGTIPDEIILATECVAERIALNAMSVAGKIGRDGKIPTYIPMTLSLARTLVDGNDPTFVPYNLGFNYYIW